MLNFLITRLRFFQIVFLILCHQNIEELIINLRLPLTLIIPLLFLLYLQHLSIPLFPEIKCCFTYLIQSHQLRRIQMPIIKFDSGKCFVSFKSILKLFLLLEVPNLLSLYLLADFFEVTDIFYGLHHKFLHIYECIGPVEDTLIIFHLPLP